jgi:hypothetical protein
MTESVIAQQLIPVLTKLDQNPNLDRALFWRWYATRRLFSNFVWDLHSAYAYRF